MNDIYKYFPYSHIRDEQHQIIKKVYGFLNDSNEFGLISQADPGIGKTACMTSQYLLAMSKGLYDKGIFVVPTDSGKISIDRELSVIGYNKYIKMYSKDILCNWLQEKKEEIPDILSGTSCGFELCRIMKHKCPYKNDSCNYYIQKQEIMEAETIICDYNYILSPFIRKFSGIDEIIEKNKTVLFVDECHKLPDRADGIYSTEISSTTIEHAIKELIEYGYDEKKYVPEKVLKLMDNRVDANKRELYHQIDEYMVDIATVILSPAFFKSLVIEKNEILSIGKKIAEEKIENNKGIISYAERVGNFLEKCRDNIQYEKNYIYFLKLKNDKKTNYIGWVPNSTSWQIKSAMSLFDKFVVYSGTIIPDKFKFAIGFGNDSAVVSSEMIESPFLKNRHDMIFSHGRLTADTRSDEFAIKEIRDNVTDIIDVLQPPIAIVCTNPWMTSLKLEDKYTILKEPKTQPEIKDWLDNLVPKNDIIYFSPHGRLAQSIDLPKLRSLLFISYPIVYDTITQARRDILSKKIKGKRGNPRRAADYITFTIPTFQSVIQSVMRGVRNEKSMLDAVYYDKRYEQNKKELNSKTLTIYKEKSLLLDAIKRRKEQKT